MFTHPTQTTQEVHDIDRQALDRRLQSTGWSLFLIWSGFLWLLPTSSLPDGLWLLGTGMILMGINVARVMNDIEVNGFTVIVGLLVLSAGLSNLMGVGFIFFPALLIVAGVIVLMQALRKGEQ